ncbi:unnamed protein product [Prunus armeniaca]|uniref:Peptidase A1 domain-containing protein n=1 Tax=Prunus armeniaca TaxID=36596 RepID=A0A6J5VBU3_PRUAR|nr:unnamed protein product [Prunus armeniaca]
MQPSQSEVKRDMDDGEGAQLMKLSIGTPPHDIYAVADTGNTLLWTQCEPCPGCYKQKNPKFDPKKSSTYGLLPCDAPECNVENDPRSYSCSNSSIDDHYHQKVCNYNYSYLDETATAGVVARETVTLTSTSGKPISFKNIVFGCGHNNTAMGTASPENEMGVVGLSFGNLSFVSQIAPYVGGRKFSHCFVPYDPGHPNVASMMNFGNGSEVSGEGVVSTPLINKEDNNLYYATAEGISVGDKFVPFNSSGSVSKGNMLLVSGTQVTTIPQDFYDGLIPQVKKAVDPTWLKPIEVNDTNPRDGALLYYNTTMDQLKGPSLTVHFDGGAKVQLSPAQAFYRYHQHKLLCFSVLNATEATNDSVSIYGSYAQSNFLIGFDL